MKIKIKIWIMPILIILMNCSDPEKNSHTEMINILSKNAMDIDPETNFYANKARLAWLQIEDDFEHMSQKIQHKAVIANEMLNAGYTNQAINGFENILNEIDSLNIQAPNDFLLGIKDMLAISHLRLGEEYNCIEGHNSESCIIPLRGSGIHRNQKGADKAIKLYSDLLKDKPNDFNYRWLLNIAYMTKDEYPEKVPQKWLIPQLLASDSISFPEFKETGNIRGLDHIGLAGGSILEDFDNDNDLDLIASSWGADDQLQYFENDGRGYFSNKTKEANLIGIKGGLNIIHADYNNDGHFDVFVLRGAWLGSNGKVPNSLLKNNGDGTFTDITISANIYSEHPTQTASWGDYNNDGWVDLFIGNESGGEEINYSELYHNNGDGTFTEKAEVLNLDLLGFIKGVVWGDIDNDGDQDLYISLLGQPNFLMINGGIDKEWKFTNKASIAGVEEPISSFPAWFFDFDNDGWLDIWVSGYDNSSGHVAMSYLGVDNQGEKPRLFKNNKDGTFTNVTVKSNMNYPLLTMGSNYGDLNNDGYLDIYAGTGDPDYRSVQPNRMFLNIEGKYFQDVTFHGRFGNIQKGHGVSFGDIDNDGDQDIHAVMGGAYEGNVYQNSLYENPGNWNNPWIGIKLIGTQTNWAAIGSKIIIETIEKEVIHRTISSGGSFGGNPFREFIGLSNTKGISKITIIWGSGNKQSLNDLSLNQWHTIEEIKS